MKLTAEEKKAFIKAGEEHSLREKRPKIPSIKLEEAKSEEKVWDLSGLDEFPPRRKQYIKII